MSINMSAVNSYSAYQNSYKSSAVREKQEMQSTKKTQNTETYVTNGQKNLSKAAQELLEKLKSEKPEMDFMVADFDKGDDAKEILSRGTKEFSVLFSSEELEKMAADEEYYAEKMQQLDGAVRMSEEINAKYGFESGFGEDGTGVSKIGIAFNSDGTTSVFLELEKVSAKQKERIEAARAEKAEAKREAAEEAEDGVGSEKQKQTLKEIMEKDRFPVKRVIVQGTTQEEIMQKISEIDWNAVKPEAQTAGAKFDFTV